jgi:glycosyltransferase involved in cell wall biosynthesis
VRFRPYQPRERLSASLSAPDLHLVSLDPACEGLIMPSKLYGILAAGRPVAFLGDPDGAVARELRAHGLGVVLDIQRPASWRARLAALRDDPPARREMGERARRHFEQTYHPKQALARWEVVLTGRDRRPATLELAAAT